MRGLVLQASTRIPSEPAVPGCEFSHTTLASAGALLWLSPWQVGRWQGVQKRLAPMCWVCGLGAASGRWLGSWVALLAAHSPLLHAAPCCCPASVGDSTGHLLAAAGALPLNFLSCLADTFQDIKLLLLVLLPLPPPQVDLLMAAVEQIITDATRLRERVIADVLAPMSAAAGAAASSSGAARGAARGAASAAAGTHAGGGGAAGTPEPGGKSSFLIDLPMLELLMFAVRPKPGGGGKRFGCVEGGMLPSHCLRDQRRPLTVLLSSLLHLLCAKP